MQHRIVNALICDIVRTENTGKQILVGVYSSDIMFTVLPAQFPCNFYFELIPSSPNININFEMRIEIPGEEKPLEVTGSLPVKDETSALIVLNAPQIMIPKTGRLNVSLRFDEGPWVLAITKKVMIRQSPLPAQ